MADCVACDG